MHYIIKHELPTRLRLNCGRYVLNEKQAMLVVSLIQMQEGVYNVRALPRSGNIVIVFDNPARKKLLLAIVKKIDDEYLLNDELLSEMEVPAKRSNLFDAILWQIGLYFVKKLLPPPVRLALLYFRTLPRIAGGILSAAKKRSFSVELLDSASIAISLFRKEYKTAQNISFLLTLGETVEEYTRKASLDNLADALSLKADSVWVVRPDGTEEEIEFARLQENDTLLLRQGAVVPVDGVVLKGAGVLNESSITGEPLPVNIFVGKTLYAGTILEEGEIHIQVKQKGSNTVVEKIVQQIDESQNLKAQAELKIERMADMLVPFNFLSAFLVWVFTKNLARTAAVLAVDYSCAIKLATPLAFLSGMHEGVNRGFIIKGGKFMESLSQSDTIVFDKTGTLTCAEPHLVDITPMQGYTRYEVLKISACLEEHFPHSVARAVVRKAEEENILHQEEHASVEYVVAHGIVSRWKNKRVIIGSHHFIFGDEKVPLSEKEKIIIQGLKQNYSLLYLAVENRLAGILSIEDAIRHESKQVIQNLKEIGFQNIYMLTGDEEKTARSIAAQAGIENVYASLLPQDKSKIIMRLKEENKIVAMVGDGINDTPALSAADVGIAMQQGATITQAVSDIALTNSSLSSLVDARILSTQVMKKIKAANQRIIAGNSLLILLGIFGKSTAAFSALMHNGITFGEALLAMRPVLAKNNPSVETNFSNEEILSLPDNELNMNGKKKSFIKGETHA